MFNIQMEHAGRESDKDVVRAAEKIINYALESPLRAILENSGVSAESRLGELRKKKKELSGEEKTWLGFDALKNNFGNLKEAGIIDPLKVTKTALMNAISVAANYLMIGAAVTEIPKKETGNAGRGMPDMGGY